MRRKTSKTKRLQGEKRPSRLKETAAERAASIGPPRMPAGLSPAVQRLWRRVVPCLIEAGLVNQLDELALVDMFATAVRLAEARAIIEKDGLIIEGYRRSKVKHPAAQLEREYRNALMSWARLFGLVPAARGRIVVETREEPELSLAEQLFAELDGGS